MTAIAATLAVLLAGTWVLLVALLRDAAAERARLIRAIVAETPQELALLERAATAKPPRQRGEDSDKPQPAPIGFA